MRSLRHYRVCLVLAGFFAVAQPVLGQTSDTGLDQFGTFQRNNIQTVNLFNLNNHIEIPIFAKKERGVDFSAKLVWDNSDSLTFVQVPYPPGGQYFRVSDGPRLLTVTDVGYRSHVVANQTCGAFPNQAMTTYFDAILDQNNTVHPMPYGTTVQTGPGCSAGAYSRTSSDGQWLLTVTYTNQNCSGQSCITSVTETDTSGNIYNGTAALSDPNGNQITASFSAPSTTTWTDATGNTVFTSNTNSATPPLVHSYAVQTGSMAKVQVNYTSGFTFQNQFGCGLPYVTGGGSLPTSVSLPDGTSYSFVYESANGSYPSTTVTGRIHSITVPAGGTWTYTYSGGNNGINCTGTPGSPATISITASDGSVWTYSRTYVANCPGGICQPGPSWQTVVTDPACNDTVYLFAATGLQMQAQSYQGTAGTASCSSSTKTLMQTVTTCYDGNFTNCGTAPGAGNCSNPGGPCRIDKYTYLPGLPQPALSETFYNTSELPTQDNEFDFGVNTGSAPTTTPLRATKTTYATIAGNILNRPSCVQVTGGASPATCGTVTSTTKSITKYLNYDTHGNVGTLQKWVTGSTYVSQNFTYYSTGLLHTATDFKQTATTTYTYGACNSSYPTTITTANISQQKAWDCNGGVVTSTTDANSKTTNYTYTNPSTGAADPFWRLVRTTYPDGGQTTTTFNDTASPVNVTANQLIDTLGHSITAQTNFDTFGRPVQALHTSDPDGTTYTATTYDVFDRTRQTYNPTRCNPPTTNCGQATWGVTTNFYDALGRLCLVVPPDGILPTGNACPAAQPSNTIFTTYSANCATVTDQAGKSRKSCSDALGRATQVFEDLAGLNYETDYTYDALDNLLTVNQKGGSTNSANWRTRTFTYDGLSRLSTATNPESGAVSYTYDNNGNVLTKTSPKPNQTGTATVVATYAYDLLNRLTQKSFNDGLTPTVKYGYDGVALSGCTTTPPVLTDGNPIGNASSMCDGAGAESWSHDPVGRVLSDSRITNAVTQTYPYTYNLDGSMKTVGYSTSETITFAQGGAGRVVSETSTLSPNTLVSAAHYAPNGAVCGLSYAGWGAAQNISFNNRFQPLHWHVSSTPWGGNPAPPPCQPPTWTASWLDLTYNYVDASSHNNGNVVRIYNVGNHAWSQNFTYDSLNRIATAQTDGTISNGAGNCWAESYNIDAWGNLLSNAPNPTTQSAYTGCLQEAPANLTGVVQPSNRLSGMGFTTDAAGNLIADGVHTFTFDAENHLLQTAQTGQTTVTYKYDGDGKRVQKSSGTVYWYGQSSAPLMETSLTGSANFSYYYFNGRITNRRNWTHYNILDTYVPDALGNTRLVSGFVPPSSGAWDFSDYYPYGGEWVHPYMCCVGNHYKFTGKERDPESNLDNFEARYYTSNLGRFTSPDPDNAGADVGNPQSWNAYAYVLNNPSNLVDPHGLWCAYLNDAGNAIENGGIDSHSNSGECNQNGGYWIEGDFGGGSFNMKIDVDKGTVMGIGYNVIGNPVASIAGAMDSNQWGAWSRTLAIDPSGLDWSTNSNGALAWTLNATNSFFTDFKLAGAAGDPRPSCIAGFGWDTLGNFVGYDAGAAAAVTQMEDIRLPHPSIPSNAKLRNNLTAKAWVRKAERARAAKAVKTGLLVDLVIAEGQALDDEVASAMNGKCK